MTPNELDALVNFLVAITKQANEQFEHHVERMKQDLDESDWNDEFAAAMTCTGRVEACNSVMTYLRDADDD